MANKREFKKYINSVSEAIVTDMMTAYYHLDGVNKDEIQKAVTDVLVAGEKAIMKSNVKFDKTEKAFENVRAFHVAKRAFFHDLYKKVNKEYADEINAALKAFNAAVPTPVKEANKAQAEA